MDLFRQALFQRRRNAQIAAEIEDGKPLEEILPDTIEQEFEIKYASRWWLEDFFWRHKLSFMKGILLIYLAKVVPAILLIPWLIGHVTSSFLNAYVSSIFGDMFIPISFILLNNVHKSLVKLKKTSNDYLRENRFVAPRTLIAEKELESSSAMEALDQNYRNRYVKPVMAKTFQTGLNLTFNGSYQIGSGVITVIMYLFLMFLGHVIRILPEGMTTVTDLGSPIVTSTSLALSFYGVGMDWFIIGMFTWTLFITFLCAIQVSGNPLRVRPFELIKERFNAISRVILNTSLTITFIVAWSSPFTLLWSVLPPDPLSRQTALYFAEVILLLMIPVIILSVLIPISAVHKGITRTRDRLLLIKDFELESLKRIRESKPGEYLKKERHLISDYKDIQSNSPWLFGSQQVLQLTGSIFLPILTFWLTIQFR